MATYIVVITMIRITTKIMMFARNKYDDDDDE